MINKKMFVTSIKNFEDVFGAKKELFKVDKSNIKYFSVGNYVPVVYLKEEKNISKESFFDDVLQVSISKVIRVSNDEVLLEKPENVCNIYSDEVFTDSSILCYLLLKNWYEDKIINSKDGFIDGYLKSIEDEFIIESLLMYIFKSSYLLKDYLSNSSVTYLEFLKDYLSADRIEKFNFYIDKFKLLDNPINTVKPDYLSDAINFEFDADDIGILDSEINFEFNFDDEDDFDDNLNLNALDDYVSSEGDFGGVESLAKNLSESIDRSEVIKKPKPGIDDDWDYLYPTGNCLSTLNRYDLLLEILEIPESGASLSQVKHLNNASLVKSIDIVRRHLLVFIIEDYLNFNDIMYYKIRKNAQLSDISSFYKFVYSQLVKCDSIPEAEKSKILDLLKSNVGLYL